MYGKVKVIFMLHLKVLWGNTLISMANYITRLTDESKTFYEAYQEHYRCNPLGDGTIDAEKTD